MGAALEPVLLISGDANRTWPFMLGGFVAAGLELWAAWLMMKPASVEWFRPAR